MKGSTRKSGTVAVTGSTGFLGSEIVARLLARDRRPILCFVRAASTDVAQRRGRDAVAAALGRPLTASERGRIHWVRGDIETAYFGLAPSVHDSLAQGVEEVFHCAASTRLDRSLRDARRTNVRGIQTVHAFACEAAAFGHFRRLHHVSTAYVVGKMSGIVQAHPISAEHGHALYRNTYEQTKAEAELWLRSRSIVPTTVYRPTVILGDSRSGRTTSWTAVHYAMNLMASDLLRFAPRDSFGRVDCVPGDYVASAILALGAREDSAGAVFHICAGSRAISVHEMVEYARRGMQRHFAEGERPKIRSEVLGPLRWGLLSLARKFSLNGRRRRALAKYAECEPYTRLDCVFENERECRLLAESGVSFPAPAAFFPHTVEYALQKNFGRTPEPRFGLGKLLPFARPAADGAVRWNEAS